MNKDFKNLKNIQKIHMIGIGGISMSAIALVLKKAGYEVTGSDRNEGEMVTILRENNISVFIGSHADLVKDADLVVYTAAIDQNDAEYIKAKNLNIPTYERAKFLGLIMENYEIPICISGTHGKTTTTSMISSIFIDANLDPNVQVGSKLKKLENLNYRIGNSEYFILEACEYVDSFLNFPHNTAVILNIDADHLDYFSGIEEIKNSFEKFILMLPENGNLIINIDDTNCLDLLTNIENKLKEKHINIYTFSLKNTEANIYAKNITCDSNGYYSFDIINKVDNKTYTFTLTVPGLHNVYDALAAITTSFVHGINFEIMVKSLNEFLGANRRFEFKKQLDNNILVYDDYAHHPTEIKATLEAAKQKKANKVIAIFQPHTFTRTKELLNEFSNAFSNADLAIITEIYAAREFDDGSISSKDLVDKLIKNNVNAIYIKDFEDIVKYLKTVTKPNDIILTIGAGNITNLSTLL